MIFRISVIFRMSLAVAIAYLAISPKIALAHNTSEDSASKLAFAQSYFSIYARYVRSLNNPASEPAYFLYHRVKHEFIPVDQVSLHRIYPPAFSPLTSNSPIFFGARMQFLPDIDGDKKVDFLGLSYLGAAQYTHEGKYFFAEIPSDTLQQTDMQLNAAFPSPLDDWVKKHKTSLMLTRHGTYIPFAFNSGDVDGNGVSDYLLGGSLVLNGKLTDNNVPPPGVFLHSGGKTYIASLSGKELQTYQWDGKRLQPLAVSHALREADGLGFSLMTAPDLLTDSADFLVVPAAEHLDFYRMNEKGTFTLSYSLQTSAGTRMLGGVADYDGDGVKDYWVAQPQSHGPDGMPTKPGLATLVSSRHLSQLKTQETILSEVAYTTVKGSLKYTDYDGVGTTLSGIFGDIDANGKPDFTLSGHRHLNETGALFIVPDRLIRENAVLEVSDPGIIKLMGTPLSQLAPPYTHWDATDYNADGYDDIVVSADSDAYSAPLAGAIYVLSGKAIMERHKQMLRSAN